MFQGVAFTSNGRIAGSASALADSMVRFSDAPTATEVKKLGAVRVRPNV